MAGESMNCRKAAELMSQALEQPLREDEQKALSHHLSLCIDCRNFKAQLSLLRRAARVFGKSTPEK